MNRSSVIFALSAALAAGGALPSRGALAAGVPPAAPGAPALPATPVPPVPPAPPATEFSTRDAVDAVSDAKQAQVEAELEAARAKLEADAREVARLSMQISKPLVARYRTTNSRANSVIGVVISTDNGPEGAHVLDVSPGGPAAEAGIRAGDVISSVNGTEVKGEESARQVVRAIRDAAPESKLKVHVLREGKPHDFVVVARPSTYFQAITRVAHPPGIPGDPAVFFDGQIAGVPPVFNFGQLGIPSLSSMQLATLTPGLGHYFGTDKGVLVVRAPTNSAFKLQDGDVILSIDGREPASGAHATRILGSYQPGEKVMLRIMRERKAVNLETKLPSPVGPGDTQFLVQPADSTS